MNTILTDDERNAVFLKACGFGASPGFDAALIQLTEAAVLAKLAQQEPVAWRYQDAKGNFRYRGYKVGFDTEYSILKPVALYANPAQQQADRPRVPTIEELTEKIASMLHGTYHCTRVWEAWNVGTMSEEDFGPVDESDTPAEIAAEIHVMLAAAPEAPALGESNLPTTDELEALYETTHYGHPADFAADVLERWGGWMPGLLGHGGALQDAVKIRERRAAPEAPAQAEQAAEPVRDEREPSPTAGMSLAQRILHVGGRNNAAGYVEFGSTQAVDALVRHVLRDLPDAPPAQTSAVDERDRKDAERYRWLREQMLGVDFDWDESGKTALCFEMPDGCSFAADCDQVIDDARAALAQKGGAA